MALSKGTHSVALCVLVAACASDTGRQANHPADEADAFGMVPSSRVQGEDEAERRTALSALSDDEIATVLETANTARIEEAKIAYPKIDDQKVKVFAQRMLADYGRLRQDGNALSARLGLEPSDGSMSSELEADSGKVRFALREAGSGPVDRTYMEAQVLALEKLSRILDARLIAAATNPELERWLESVRSRVNEHLEQAREVSKALETEPASSGAQPATTGAP